MTKRSQYFQTREQATVGTKLVSWLILDDLCPEIVKYKYIRKLKKLPGLYSLTSHKESKCNSKKYKAEYMLPTETNYENP